MFRHDDEGVVHDVVRKGKVSPFSPSWVLVTGHIIKLTQDRLTGEKETHLDSWTGSFIEMGPKKWSKQVVYICSTQTNFQITRQRNLGLGNFVYTDFLAPNSFFLAIMECFFLLVQGSYLTNERFIISFQGSERKVTGSFLPKLFPK